MQTGQQLHKLETMYTLRGIAFHPGGARLITWGGEWDGYGAITIWDAITGQELLTLQSDFLVMQAAFARDGLSLGAIDSSGKVAILNAAPPPVR